MTREEAKEAIKDAFGNSEYTDELIKTLEQEPKMGHWMKSNIGGAKVCSVCNAHMGLSSFKFCPSCGAKMVEPQESEENK